MIVVSLEGPEDARLTQEQFPHLLVLSDAEQDLSRAAGLIHKGASPDGRDADAPTTMIVDRTGTIRWIYRSTKFIARLTPNEILDELDRIPVAPN